MWVTPRQNERTVGKELFGWAQSLKDRPYGVIGGFGGREGLRAIVMGDEDGGHIRSV